MRKTFTNIDPRYGGRVEVSLTAYKQFQKDAVEEGNSDIALISFAQDDNGIYEIDQFGGSLKIAEPKEELAQHLIRSFDANLIGFGELFDAFLDLTEEQCELRMRQDNLDLVERKREMEVTEQIAMLKAFIKEKNGSLK